MCGTAMPQVNSDANTPPGDPAWCISSQMITASAPSPPPPPTDLGQTRRRAARASPALRCSSRGSSPVALPLVDVRQHLAFGERPHRLSQIARARAVVQMLTASSASGMSSAGTAQPFAEALGLRVEAGLVGDALAEDALDDEVDRPQVGQHMAGDRQIGCLGQQFAQLSTVSACASQRHCVVACAPTRRRWRCRPCRRCARRRCGRAARAGSRRTGSGSGSAGVGNRPPAPGSRVARAMSVRVPSAQHRDVRHLGGVDVARR